MKKPVAFAQWLESLRDDPKARKAAVDILHDKDHPHYPALTKLVWAYTEGLPVKRVVTMDLSPQRQETGEQVLERVLAAVLNLAQVKGGDPRWVQLQQIQGAEKVLAEVK